MSEYFKREPRTFIEIADDLNDLVSELNDKIVESIREKNAGVTPVRHGWWKHERLPSTSGGSYAVVRCSVCEHQYPMTETNYCPSCGAKMDKEIK